MQRAQGIFPVHLTFLSLQRLLGSVRRNEHYLRLQRHTMQPEHILLAFEVDQLGCEQHPSNQGIC
jgi:hypothetical protein